MLRIRALQAAMRGLDAFKRVLNSGEVITPNASFAGTGTVTTSTTTTTVTGNGTSFSTQLSVGDQITVGSQTQTVMAIAGNTSLLSWLTGQAQLREVHIQLFPAVISPSERIRKYTADQLEYGLCSRLNFDSNTTITGIYLTGMVFTVYNGANNSFIWKTVSLR